MSSMKSKICVAANRIRPLALVMLTVGLWLGWQPESLPAQSPRTYTLKGQILSLLDGMPLPGISVYLKGTSLTAVTDSAGVFRIRRVPPGTYDLVAKYPDFEATILRGINIPPKARKSFVFTLQPEKEVAPVPLIDSVKVDTLGWLEGQVNVRIDTFYQVFEEGWLVLKAMVAGNITESYIYPRLWKLLPVEEQHFRFKFFLPTGKKYRLYLIWRQESGGIIRENIVEVARHPQHPGRARLFDLTNRRSLTGITVNLESAKIANILHDAGSEPLGTK